MSRRGLRLKTIVGVISLPLFLTVVFYYKYGTPTLSGDQTTAGRSDIGHGRPDSGHLPALSLNRNDEDVLQREFSVDTVKRIEAQPLYRIRTTVLKALEDMDQTSLSSLSLDEVSELYHRYVNTLQFFCPITDKLGGVGQGWTVCTGFSDEGKCSVYLITNRNNTDSYLKSDIDQVYKCSKKTIYVEEIQNEMTGSSRGHTNDLVNMDRIDVLIINAAEKSHDVVAWLLKHGALKHVSQLSVNFHAVSDVTSKTDYVTQILLLKELYKEGFRIFHFEKNPNFILKSDPWRTGAFRLNMMRERTVKSPMVLPTNAELTSMSVAEMAKIYVSFILTTEILCKEILRVGSIGDGGWDVCMDDKYRPNSPCLVYSFGIKQDWSFDDRVASRLGCEVHAFDPSIGQQDHMRSRLQWFHNLGLLDMNGTVTRKGVQWNMMDLMSIMTSLGHTNRRIDVLKMDIESSEWAAIPNMIATGALNNVKQLYVEVHGNTNGLNKRFLEKLRALHDSGFRLYWSHGNQVAVNLMKSRHTGRQVSACYELYYLNTKLQ